MKADTATLEEVYTEAKADVARGSSPELALKWAFRHARAIARRTRAEEAARAHEHDRTRALYNLPAGGDAAALTTQSLHAAASDLAEARAVEAACEHTLRLIEKAPARAAAPLATVKPKAA